MFDKLKFWKKADPLDQPLDLGLPKLDEPSDPFAQPNFNAPNFNNPNFNVTSPSTFSQPSFSAQPSLSQPTFSQPEAPSHFDNFTQYNPQQFAQPAKQESIHPRDVELILAKLETIKVSIDHLATRVEQLERSRKGW